MRELLKGCPEREFMKKLIVMIQQKEMMLIQWKEMVPWKTMSSVTVQTNMIKGQDESSCNLKLKDEGKNDDLLKVMKISAAP